MAGEAPPAEGQALSMPPVGDVPAEAFAPRQDDAPGVPAPPVPLSCCAEASSDTAEGWLPQLVPRLASVGTPGEAVVSEQVDAVVGSCAEPMPAADPPAALVAFTRSLAPMRESAVDTLERLASAFAVGPDVAGEGAEPSGAEGSGCVAVVLVGTFARVPGPDADVDPPDPELGRVLLLLDAPMGSLDATLAGPALPGVADALPPPVEESVPGCRFGCAFALGGSALAWSALRLRRVATAMT